MTFIVDQATQSSIKRFRKWLCSVRSGLSILRQRSAMPVADVSCGQRTRVLHPESSFSKHKFQLLTVHCTCKIISIYSSWSSRMPNIKFSHFPYPFWFVQTKVYFPKQSWLRTQNYSKRGGEEQLKESDIEYINFTFHREEERKNGIKNYPRIRSIRLVVENQFFIPSNSPVVESKTWKNLIRFAISAFPPCKHTYAPLSRQ